MALRDQRNPFAEEFFDVALDRCELVAHKFWSGPGETTGRRIEDFEIVFLFL
jgi:hypothetical protein